jgi:hypothetical protein
MTQEDCSAGTLENYRTEVHNLALVTIYNIPASSILLVVDYMQHNLLILIISLTYFIPKHFLHETLSVTFQLLATFTPQNNYSLQTRILLQYFALKAAFIFKDDFKF